MHCLYDGCEIDRIYNEKYCLLHSSNQNKDTLKFKNALKHYIQNQGYNCEGFNFPIEVNLNDELWKGSKFASQINFSNSIFRENFVCRNCTFNESVFFNKTVFKKEANFSKAIFHKSVIFNSTFEGRAQFEGAIFNITVVFEESQFFDRVFFINTKFDSVAGFEGVVFDQGAKFQGVNIRDLINFTGASFLGPTYFSQGEAESLIFKDVRVKFDEVIIDPPNICTFINADLSKCLFRNTNVTKIEFSGVRWPIKDKKLKVYDELDAIAQNENGKVHESNIEELYRQLKCKYEAKRDFTIASDFHYAEKEYQRLDPNTSRTNKVLLYLYKSISGYGEKLRPAFISICLLIGIAAILYGFAEVHPIGEEYKYRSSFQHIVDSIVYSLQVSFYIRPTDFETTAYWSKFVFIIQSILSPVFIGLLALVIRQRMKR